MLERITKYIQTLSIILSILFLAAGSAYSQNKWAMKNYPPMDTSVKVTSSNLPLIWITTTDTISRHVRSLAYMKVINNDEGKNYADTVAHPDQNVEFDGPISIKWRGTTSFGEDGEQTKKPMSVKTLKTEDIKGKKDKVKLLGMGKDSDWCLLAPWQDQSYIREVITVEMAFGGYVFAPKMKYCEVFVDGIYYGVYIFTERASKGSKRLNLWDYGVDGDGNPIDDTTGDFQVYLDRDAHNVTHVVEPHYTSQYHPTLNDGTVLTDRNTCYQYKHPEEEDFADLPGAREALHKAIDDMESAFASEDYGNLYADYIDVESFMDYEIAHEAANNIDAYRLSTPMWKHSATHAARLGGNDKWKMGLWDFNLAYANPLVYFYFPSGEEWRYATNDMMAANPLWWEKELIPFYWIKLPKDEAYNNGLKARYTQRRLSSYTNNRVAAICDSLKSLLKQGSASRDNKAWKNRFKSYKTEIDKVQQFIYNRLAWMDERLLDKDLLSDVVLEGITLRKDGSWNTLCLPFRLSTIEGTPLEGATIKTLYSTDFANGTLTLNFTPSRITSLEAGKPYLVKWEQGENISDPTFRNMTNNDIDASTIETEYVDLVGTFDPITLAAEDKTALYIDDTNTLNSPTEEVTINPYQTYFRLKGGLATGGTDPTLTIRAFKFNFDENDTDAIISVFRDSKPVDNSWYTLDGRRLHSAPTTSGFYLHNGQKVIIKAGE